MKVPSHYVPHLDHRVSVLLSFTIRRDRGYFGPDHGESRQVGDLYRASLEGAGIMLRSLIEFLGAQCDHKATPPRLIPKKGSDAFLGVGDLGHIPPVDVSKIPPAMESLLAKLHDGVSKRTGHPAFKKVSDGLDPDELRSASAWIVRALWESCYDPDPLVVHGDIIVLLGSPAWSGVPLAISK
jgi:hypothetical protein